MIKVVAKVTVKEGMTDAFLAAAKPLVTASQKDDGNIFYTLNVSVDNPRVFAIMECWENKEVLEKHMQTEHFKTATGSIGEAAEGEMSIELFTEV